MHNNEGTTYSLQKPNKDDGLELLWSKWEVLIKKSEKERILLDDFEKFSMEEPFGVKKGLARLLSTIKLFQNLTHVSLYKIDGTSNKEQFIQEITDDMIDIIMHRPHLIRIKYVKTEKIHQNLFNELYSVLKGVQKDAITLLDIVKPLIKFVNGLSDYTKSTISNGLSYHKVIQLIIKSVYPEDLIYREIPKAFGLKEVSENSTKKEIKVYVESLKKWHNKIQLFNEKIIDIPHKEFKKLWGIPRKSNLDDTYKFMQNQITDDVDSFIIDFKLKEFSDRVRRNTQDKNTWFKSILSALGDARIRNWNDADHKHFLDTTILYRVRIDEAIELARKSNLKKAFKSYSTKELQNKIIKLLELEGGRADENLAALIRVQEEIELKLKKK